MNLSNKTCIMCEGGTPPLTSEVARKYLTETPDWSMEDDKIVRDFKFKNFKEALAFVNKVAELAEHEGHHPDILIHGWNKVKIELTTHAIKGLSENDFIMAAKINGIL